MALSITVNGGGTFSASMEEGPVSFTATLGAVPGPKGDTGATGPAGVVSATAPITYDSGTQTIGISATPTFTSVTATTVNATNLVFADATTQTTAFVGEARKVYVIARNSTGSTIAKGKVVYLSGGTGNVPNVSLAQADSEATSARTIGITAEAISNNANGKVIISGAIENIDTSAFSDGDTVYLSSSVAGGLQTTLPAAPLHGVVIGIVTRANPSVGSIEVAINNYQELKELSDVNVSDRANNDGLFWEAISSTWRSKTVAEALGYTPIAINSLSASAPISYNSGTGAFTFDSSGFLLKADNLSGLASASTARTNLGLGTMATETASNYALLASPAFTGNPTAPTPATSDNDTSIATTAFVNAYCPSASTTTAGKVELATDAEAQTGTSTTLAVTPAGLREAILDPRYRTQFSAAGWTQVISGGGSTTSVDFGIALAPGSLSGGYAIRRNGASSTAALSRGRARGIIDFSKRFEMSFSMLVTGAIVSDQVFRATIGKNTTDNNGDLARAGIGIKLVGPSSLYLQVNNGTTLANVLSTHTHVASETYDVRIESDGAGNVTLYVNDTSVATSTGGPTGQTAATANQVQVEGENLAAVTARSAEFSNFQLFLGR